MEGKVSGEPKRVILMEDIHFVQALNYIKVFKLEVALLIDFNSKS